MEPCQYLIRKSDSSDEEMNMKSEDPLLMRPQPPRGRMSAVLAVRSDLYSSKLKKGRQTFQHLVSAVMQKELNKLYSKQSQIKAKGTTCEKIGRKSSEPNEQPINLPHFLKDLKTETIDITTESEPPTPNFIEECFNDDYSGDISEGYKSECNVDPNQIKANKQKHRRKKKKKKKLKEELLIPSKQNKPSKSSQQSCNRPNCQYVSFSRMELNIHKREVHRNSRDFTCDQCNYSSASAADLRKHCRVHSGEKPYQCNHAGCTFRGRHSNSLDYHLKKVHPTGDPLKCDIEGCGFTTYISMSLKNHHIKNHGNGKTIACSLCAYRCYLPADLRKHLQAHSGNTPYACDWPGCSYACKISSNLRKHKRIHTEERPYACDKCVFRSNFISSLKAHKRIHTNERPFCCEQCGYRCNSTSNLKKHILQRHPGMIYSGPGGTGAAIRAAKFASAGTNKTISLSVQTKCNENTLISTDEICKSEVQNTYL